MDTQFIIAKAQLSNAIRACTNCPLHQVGNGPIPLRAPNNPTRIAIVGEAPGKEEDDVLRPFVGPSGRLATAWLRGCGIDPEEVGWVNTVSCFPNRTPTHKEVVACAENLRSQLSLLSPSFVLLLGGVAVSAYWPRIRLGDIRGQWFRIPVGRVRSNAAELHEHSIGGEATKGTDNVARSAADAAMAEGRTAWALATWHPAAVLRNNSLAQQAMQDVHSFRYTSVTHRDIRHPSIGHPFNRLCVSCGGIADVWEESPGVISDKGYGIAWCSKHWSVKEGIAGGGREKEPSTKSTRRSAKSPSKPRKVKPVQETMI